MANTSNSQYFEVGYIFYQVAKIYWKMINCMGGIHNFFDSICWTYVSIYQFMVII